MLVNRGSAKFANPRFRPLWLLKCQRLRCQRYCCFQILFSSCMAWSWPPYQTCYNILWLCMLQAGCYENQNGAVAWTHFDKALMPSLAYAMVFMVLLCSSRFSKISKAERTCFSLINITAGKKEIVTPDHICLDNPKPEACVNGKTALLQRSGL